MHFTIKKINNITISNEKLYHFEAESTATVLTSGSDCIETGDMLTM